MQPRRGGEAGPADPAAAAPQALLASRRSTGTKRSHALAPKRPPPPAAYGRGRRAAGRGSLRPKTVLVKVKVRTGTKGRPATPRAAYRKPPPKAPKKKAATPAKPKAKLKPKATPQKKKKKPKKAPAAQKKKLKPAAAIKKKPAAKKSRRKSKTTQTLPDIRHLDADMDEWRAAAPDDTVV